MFSNKFEILTTGTDNLKLIDLHCFKNGLVNFIELMIFWKVKLSRNVLNDWHYSLVLSNCFIHIGFFKGFSSLVCLLIGWKSFFKDLFILYFAFINFFVFNIRMRVVVNLFIYFFHLFSVDNFYFSWYFLSLQMCISIIV